MKVAEVLVLRYCNRTSSRSNVRGARSEVASGRIGCDGACNAGSGRHLSCNLQHVSKALIVEAGHRHEVVGQGVGVPRFQLLN